MAGDIIGAIDFSSHMTDGFPPWVDKSPKFSFAATNFVRTLTRAILHDLRGRENSVDVLRVKVREWVWMVLTDK
jgi:hypothetical protein